MTTVKRLKVIGAVTVTAIGMMMGSSHQIAAAGEAASVESSSLLSLETMTCRDLLKLDSDGRDFTIIFFHGVLSGERSEMIFDPDKLAQATDKIVDHCIDHPSATLIGTYRTVRQ